MLKYSRCPGLGIGASETCPSVAIYPLLLNNEVVGGIGTSGGSVEEDMVCAQAGVAVFSAWARKNFS